MRKLKDDSQNMVPIIVEKHRTRKDYIVDIVLRKTGRNYDASSNFLLFTCFKQNCYIYSELK